VAWHAAGRGWSQQQYGAGIPPATYVWLIGYHGHLAFAVYVETGISGGRTAGPVAAAFLRATPSAA
jgi:hypothetical protein